MIAAAVYLQNWENNSFCVIGVLLQVSFVEFFLFFSVSDTQKLKTAKKLVFFFEAVTTRNLPAKWLYP